MSRTVDKRIVEMDLNNKNFETNAKTSISTIQKLKQALKMDGAEDGFYKVERAAASVNLNPIVESIENLQKKFDSFGIFGIEVMRRISNAAIDTGKRIWDTTIGQIKSGGSARAMNIANAQFKLEGLGVEWEKASKDISAAVDGTAYGFDAAANTASQLATAGIELGEAYGGMAHSLKAVSGIAAMTNSTYEEIGYIFSQIASAGRLMGQDAMQISQRGINVTATLAKQLGKTTAEIQDMQSKGQISFAMFAEAMNDAFGDQAAKANNTFQGALSNVRAALSRIGEIWYGPFYNAAITPLNKIRVAINDIKKAFDDGNDSTEDFKTRLTELMNIVSNIFSWLTENVNLTFFNKVADGANMVLDGMNAVGHAIEKTLGIFKTDKEVEETEKLTDSLENLTQAELDAAKAIWNVGKYGNGQERIDNLLAAGFTEEGARRVQLAINKFIDSNYQWMEVEEKVGEEIGNTEKKTESLSQAITSKFVRSFTAGRLAVSVLGKAFENLFEGAWNIIRVVGTSFVEVFDFDLIFEDIRDIAYKIKGLTEIFKNFTDGNTTLKRVFDEIFRVANSFYRVIRAAGSIINSIFNALLIVVGSLVKDLDIGGVSISKFTDKIADWAENLAHIVRDSQVFVKIFATILSISKELLIYASKIPAKLEPFFAKAKNNIDIILNKFKELTGIDVASGIRKAIDIIKDFFRVLSDPFAKTDDGKTAIEAWAINARDAIINVFGNPDSLFNKLKEWFKGAFEKIKSDPKSVIPKGLFESIGHALADLVVWLGNMDITSLLKIVRNILGVVLVISSVIAAMKINKLLDTIKKPVDSIKTIVTSFTGLITQLKTMSERITKAVEIDLMANAFIKFASGIAIMAAAIVGLGLIDTKTLVKGLTALSICVVLLAGSIALYNRTIDVNGIRLLDTTMIQFGLSVGMMAAIVAVMGRMDYESLSKGLIMITYLTLLYGSLMVMNRVFRGGKNDIWKGMVALAIAVDAMIPVVKIIGQMKSKAAIQGIIAMNLILDQLVGVTAAMAVLSEKFDALDVLGISGSIGLLAIVMNAAIPFFELIGNMKTGAFVQSIVGFGVVLAAMAGVLVVASKALTGLDTIDTVLIAASVGILALSIDALIPSIVALGAMERIQEGSVFEAISSLATIVIAMGAVITGMSLLGLSTNMLTVAASLAGVVVSFNLLIPGLLALAAIPSDKLWKVVGQLGVLALIFTSMIGILAAIDAGTGKSVTLILAAFAVQLAEIGFTIIAGALAIGTAAIQIGNAAVKLVASVDKFGRIDGSRLETNAVSLVSSIMIIAKGLLAAAPDITAATAMLIGGIVGGLAKGIYDAIPMISEACNTIVFYIGETLLSNIALLAAGIILGTTKALLFVAEWLVDDTGGKSILERIGNALIDIFIVVLTVLSDRAHEIAEVIVNFIIAALVALTDVINRRGDELTRAMAEALAAIIVWTDKTVDKLEDSIKQSSAKIVTYLVKGIEDQTKQFKQKIQKWVYDRIQDIKEFFDIKDGDNRGTVWYKIGLKAIDLLVDGIKAAWDGGHILKAALGNVGWMNEFIDAAWADLTKGMDDASVTYTPEMANAFHDSLESAMADGMGIHSPSTETWEGGLNLIKGLIEGVKDNLGLADFSLTSMFGGLKDKVLESVGLEEGESFLDLLGINTVDPNEFTLTPVLDASQFEKDMSNLYSDYNIDTGYGVGNYSSSLANDIGTSTYGGVSSSGFTTEDVSGLRTDVQDIAERIGRLEVRMDTGALVGALYAGIDEKLGEKQILAGRGVYA